MSHSYLHVPEHEICWCYRYGTPWQRHKKPYWKPPKWYKKIRVRRFRAQIRAALVNGREYPIDKKVDVWNWL